MFFKSVQKLKYFPPIILSSSCKCSARLPNLFATCFKKISFWINYLKRLEVVDENVWEPEFVDQLQVDRDEGLPGVGSRAGIQLFQEPIGNVQPRLLPKNVEVAAERHRVFLKIHQITNDI